MNYLNSLFCKIHVKDSTSKNVILFYLVLISVSAISLSFSSNVYSTTGQDELFFPSTTSVSDSGNNTVSSSDFASIEKNNLLIGGELETIGEYRHNRGSNFSSDTISNPNFLHIYFDANKNNVNDLRLYTNAKYSYNPSLDETSTDPITSKKYSQSDINLEELKLSFQLKHKLFLTVGKQKIKWGASKFWNPTDFINETNKDITKSIDERQGVSLIKMHIPINSDNIYFIINNSNANTPDKISTAVRLEKSFSSSEYSLSIATNQQGKILYGADVSFPFDDIDLYGELAVSPSIQAQDADSAAASTAIGFSYEFNYSDNKSIIFSSEYLYHENGYTSAPNYFMLVAASNKFIPYTYAKHYGLVSIFSSNPLFLTNTDISLITVTNLIDKSYMTKLSFFNSSINDLAIGPSVEYYYGNKHGEFTFLGNVICLLVSLKMSF